MNLFGTIVVGVTVFVLGQIVLKWFIEPVQHLRGTIAEVAYYLSKDDVVIHGVGTLKEELCEAVSANLQQLGARLISGQYLIPFYTQLRKVFTLPEQEKLKEAAECLAKIPAHMYGNDPLKHQRLDLYRIQVCELLGFPDPVNKGISKEDLISDIQNSLRVSHDR